MGGCDSGLIPQLGYVDFIRLMSEARVVFTDSGGIQDETTMLGVPCITLEDTTGKTNYAQARH